MGGGTIRRIIGKNGVAGAIPEYAKADPNSREIIEYAICPHGQDADNEMLLPIGAKFLPDNLDRLGKHGNCERACEEVRSICRYRIKQGALRLCVSFVCT